MSNIPKDSVQLKKASTYVGRVSRSPGPSVVESAIPLVVATGLEARPTASRDTEEVVANVEP